MEQSTESDKQAIRQLIAEWMESSRAGNIEKTLSLMTDDVVFLVVGHPPFGKEAFKQASANMAGIEFDGSSEIQEIEVHGNWAWTRCHLTVNTKPPDGKSLRRSGYTLTIFRKEADGRWLLARDANLLTIDDNTPG